MSVTANFIRLLHTLLVLFVIGVPFLADNQSWCIFAIHCMTVITLLVHWWTKQSACFLTLLESTLRGIPSHRSFMHSIVNPVYQIDDTELKRLVHLVTPILGIISAIRLSSKWKEMKDDIDRFLRGRERLVD
jgi:hypothetical protein